MELVVLWGGGQVPGPANTNIDYVNIDSTGNAIDFGDLSDDRRFRIKLLKNKRNIWLWFMWIQCNRFCITIASTGGDTRFW